MKLDLSSTLYLVAAVQAMILVAVILRKPRVLYSEKYLVACLIALTITLVHYVCIINKLIAGRSIFMDLSAITWLSVSPLLYLYVKALVGKEQHWSWKYLRYFPFSIYLLLQMGLISLGFYYGFFLLFKDAATYTICWIGLYLINSLFFSLWSIKKLKDKSIPLKQRERLQWLVNYFMAFSAVLVVLIGVLFWSWSADYFMKNFEFYLLVFYAILIITLVIKSLRFSNYFNVLSNDHYGQNQKDNQELAHLYQKLNTFINQEKPYLDPKLSLHHLSKQTDIPSNQLSQIFTRYLDSNFYQYINQYCLKEFEYQVNQHGTQQYTIMALAEASGFASKATFYKVFKEVHGVSPSVYLKNRA